MFTFLSWNLNVNLFPSFFCLVTAAFPFLLPPPLFCLCAKVCYHCLSVRNGNIICIVGPVWMSTHLPYNALLLLHLYHSSVWKVPLFSLFHPSLLCGLWSIIMSVGKAMARLCALEGLPTHWRKMMHRPEYHPTLFSSKSFTPTTNVVLRLCRTALFLLHTPTNTQRDMVITKTWWSTGCAIFFFTCGFVLIDSYRHRGSTCNWILVITQHYTNFSAS